MASHYVLHSRYHHLKYLCQEDEEKLLKEKDGRNSLMVRYPLRQEENKKVEMNENLQLCFTHKHQYPS